LSSNVVKPGGSLAVAEPVKLAPVTHVRSKSTRGKNSSHSAGSTVHAASAYASTKQSTAKAKPPSAPTKKNPSTKN